MSDTLDTIAYYHVAYRTHRIMNPLSVDRFRSLVTSCGIPPSPRVFDAGCGKGWPSLVLAQSLNAHCLMADTSPLWIQEATALFQAHGLEEHADLRCTDAQTLCDVIDPVDVALCLGTAQLFGGFEAALDALLHCVPEGGTIIIGEPSIDGSVPAPYRTYLREAGWEVLRSHMYFDIAISRDLELITVQRASAEEWDEYMGRQWASLKDHATAHPEDPVALDWLDWMRDEQVMYLEYQRRYMTWNVFVFRVDG